MSKGRALRHWLRRNFLWGLLFCGTVGLFFAYRWAEKQRSYPPMMRPVSGGSGVTVRLENAPFQGYTNNHLAWTLLADEIEMQRIPGGSLANVASATLTGIKNGALYDVPADIAPVLAASTAPRSDPTNTPVAEPTEKLLFSTKHGKLKPAATFRARIGYYNLGNTEPLPQELAALYNVQWRFKLIGEVELRTSVGDSLRADTITILELMNKRTWRLERRIWCDAGVRVTSRGVLMQSNKAQYAPKDRTIECTEGVRATYHNNTVQAERLFWFLGEQTIRCPETASGTLRGTPYTADKVVIDLKRRRLSAAHIRLQISQDTLHEFSPD